MKPLLCRIAAISLCVVATAGALAQTVAPGAARPATAADISVADFFRLPTYSQMVLSPGGRKVAALTPINGRENLVVIDLETRKSTPATNFSAVDIISFSWVDDKRLVLRAADQRLDPGSNRGGTLLAVDTDGGNARNLRPDVRGTFEVLSRTRDGSGDLIIGTHLREADSQDVYRLDTRTGRSKLLSFDTPGRVEGWVVDQRFVPRVATRIEKRENADEPRRRTLWHRKSDAEPWKQFSEQSDDIERMRPLAIDDDNQTLYVASRQGRDLTAIYRFDTATMRFGEIVAQHPWIDIEDGLVIQPATGKVLGVRHSAEMPGTSWFDSGYAAIQASVDRALPGTVNRVMPGDDAGRYVLVFAQSATDPGTYHVFDTRWRSLERVAAVRDWLPAALMPERRFVMYKARDGLNIPAWLTVPRGVEAKNLPLIVNVHGGPWARSYHGIQWGRLPTAQFLASRGYAVLEPEPRGSMGFGARHYRQSFKQWGLAMQDDITDGALHLVKEGIVNRDRMCLMGGSYGGYAALQGLVRDPDLWKCGNAYVAVTDLELKQNVTWSDIARYSDFYATDFKRWIGDAEEDEARFTATSPAKNASVIKAGVMLTMGAQDERVPLIHGTVMRDALRKAGKPVEYKIYVNEGHGFNGRENVIDFYTRSEQFFAKYLKP